MARGMVSFLVKPLRADRKKMRHIMCEDSNNTFALHRDLNDDHRWNITHRPTGYAVSKVGLSEEDARRVFEVVTDHHNATGGWSFTHIGRIPKDTRAFAQKLLWSIAVVKR